MLKIKALLASAGPLGLLLSVCIAIVTSLHAQESERHTGWSVHLQKWSLQSSAKVGGSGKMISATSYRPDDWYPTRVPRTVLATLIDNRAYPDPTFGMNLRSIPGCDYRLGGNFANGAMSTNSPFAVPWWYRTEFQVPARFQGSHLWLHLDGINFRANIWLNGKQVATSDQIAGAFRVHEVDITDYVNLRGSNGLAIEVFAQRQDDLGWTFADWNPMPCDKEMGLYRGVSLLGSGPVTVRYPQVVTRLDKSAHPVAHLIVSAELYNSSEATQRGTLRGSIGNRRFEQSVRVGPGERKTITFSPRIFSQLNFVKPELWWPAQMGTPKLHDLNMEFDLASGEVSDQQKVRFGIREITSELDSQGHRLFRVNGQKLLIRGGGWASDILLRFDPDRTRREFDYVRDLNLNTIRLEGQLQPDEFFDLADEYGILIFAGWCCCSQWEHWMHRPDYQRNPIWDDEDYEIAAKSTVNQIQRLRNHPSLLVWNYGSDTHPPPIVEKSYIDILANYHWPNPFLSSVSDTPSELSGQTGVKERGPYDWVPPSYWYLDTNLGGAFGFATETSPGPAVPPLESLRKMFGGDHLWPVDGVWSYHAGSTNYGNIKVFTDALQARYGPSSSVEEFAKKSQAMAYEAERAMFEAYTAERYRSTGIIQWMLNNAWPSLIWHLYDYYLVPGGGYFGTKKACEPLHVLFHYGDRSIRVSNLTDRRFEKLRITAAVFDVESNERFRRSSTVDVSKDEVITAFHLPEISNLSSAYFLHLSLTDAVGQIVSSNFYWLSTKADIMDWEKSSSSVTPTTSYADMTQLEQLKPANVSVQVNAKSVEGTEYLQVKLSNDSRNIAFFNRLQVITADDIEILPVLWQDNFISLLPGDQQMVTATYKLKDLPHESSKLMLLLEGWNSVTVRVPLGTSSQLTQTWSRGKVARGILKQK